MNTIENNRFFRTKVLLSAYGALLGEISPPMRTIKVVWNENEIKIYAYIDQEIQEEDWESVSCMATEIAADFLSIQVNFEVIRYDYPKPLNGLPGYTIYRRRETY